MIPQDVREKAREIAKEINYHNYRYYVLNDPVISDAAYDALMDELRAVVLSQARRGALKTPLPVGLVYDAADNVVLDPDGQVRKSIAHLFEVFERTGSARAVVKHFREQGLRFPRRPRQGPHKGELLWEPLRHWRVLRVLHTLSSHMIPDDQVLWFSRSLPPLLRLVLPVTLLISHGNYIFWRSR